MNVNEWATKELEPEIPTVMSILNDYRDTISVYMDTFGAITRYRVARLIQNAIRAGYKF